MSAPSAFANAACGEPCAKKFPTASVKALWLSAIVRLTKLSLLASTVFVRRPRTRIAASAAALPSKPASTVTSFDVGGRPRFGGTEIFASVGGSKPGASV